MCHILIQRLVTGVVHRPAPFSLAFECSALSEIDSAELAANRCPHNIRRRAWLPLDINILRHNWICLAIFKLKWAVSHGVVHRVLCLGETNAAKEFMH